MNKIFCSLALLLIIISPNNLFAQTAREAARISLTNRLYFALFGGLIIFILYLISFGVVYLINVDKEPQDKIDIFSEKNRKILFWVGIIGLAIIVTILKR
jgi:hypothetical protein